VMGVSLDLKVRRASPPVEVDALSVCSSLTPW
jgi:hypothetical protein